MCRLIPGREHGSVRGLVWQQSAGRGALMRWTGRAATVEQVGTMPGRRQASALSRDEAEVVAGFESVVTTRPGGLSR